MVAKTQSSRRGRRSAALRQEEGRPHRRLEFANWKTIRRWTLAASGVKNAGIKIIIKNVILRPFNG